VLGAASLFLFVGSFGFAGGAAAQSAPRHKLVVYYGDETSARAAQSENYATLLAVLRMSPSPLAAGAVDNILADAAGLPRLVQRDADALRDQARRLGFDLATFTNAMAFEHRYLFLRGETGIEDSRDLPPIPATTSTILATSPLSRPEYLRAALLAVGVLYPPHSLDIVLIANGHGGGDMALFPRVNTDLSRVGAALVMKEMLETDANGTPPPWAVTQGTSKMTFWRLIAEASASYGARFPLVFRETCESGLQGLAEWWVVPASVGLIADSGIEDLDGWNFDYARILGTASPGSDWIATLATGLRTEGIHVATRKMASIGAMVIDLRQIPVFFYLAPLAIWIAWYATVFVRARRLSAPARKSVEMNL
jgi:hypothetical protein